MIPRMLEHGWLQRRRAREDSRTYAVRLTPSGKQALTAADLPAARARKPFSRPFVACDATSSDLL